MREYERLVRNAIESFRGDVGRVPTTAEGLAVLTARPLSVPLWRGPYMLAAVKQDPWGNPYVYTTTDPKGVQFSLFSAGPDGVPNTTDDVR